MRKLVLTGGPCAGKTSIAQAVAAVFGDGVVLVPESASLLFRGGFPRWSDDESKKSQQRAIFQVQSEMEWLYGMKYPGRLLILDRGTLDGATYWPGGHEGFFNEFHTTYQRECARYERVIYLETPDADVYEANRASNPARNEPWLEARRLDDKLRTIWLEHPNVSLVSSTRNFEEKTGAVLAMVKDFLSAELRLH